MCDIKADYFTSSPDIYALLKENARNNRRNMTDAETVLWEYLRSWPRPNRFRRQHIIGDYIVDFACLNSNLVIEVDGEYHFTQQQAMLDNQRTQYLESKGFLVLRFTNQQIMENVNDVVRKIKEAIYNESIQTEIII